MNDTLESKLILLQEMNQKKANAYTYNKLQSEIMRKGLKVNNTMKVLKYIDPSLTQLSKASKVYVKWLKEESVFNTEKRNKALGLIPDKYQEEFKKYPTALEIRTRYKHGKKNTQYQNMKLGIEYNKWLYKFMESDNA